MAVEVRPSGKSGRPWYLVLALLVCSGLGACGATDGWQTIEIYRGAQIEVSRDLGEDGVREDERKMVQAAVDNMLTAMDIERRRKFPLAAAELVLGVAMFLFAAGAMMGRSGARRAVVQLAIVQVLLVLATFLLTPKLRWTQIDIVLAQANARALAHGESPQALEAIRVFYRGLLVVGLFVRSLVGALIVVALTRRRTLAFYEAQRETPTEG